MSLNIRSFPDLEDSKPLRRKRQLKAPEHARARAVRKKSRGNAPIVIRRPNRPPPGTNRTWSIHGRFTSKPDHYTAGHATPVTAGANAGRCLSHQDPIDTRRALLGWAAITTFVRGRHQRLCQAAAGHADTANTQNTEWPGAKLMAYWRPISQAIQAAGYRLEAVGRLKSSRLHSTSVHSG
jgi:hypothetical protein